MNHEPKPLDILSKVSGLTPEVIRQIAEEVKENHRKLSSCPRHEFVEPEDRLRGKYRCSVCGGEIDGIAHHWYALGLEHGKVSR